MLVVRLLGPLEVSLHGKPVPLTAGRQRTLLAVLAMSAGEVVSVDRLAAALWGDELPANPRRSVQTYVTRLRAALGGDLIGTTAAGYRLHAKPDQVDALRFTRLLDAAAEDMGTSMERARIVEALALWRGAPFEGMRSAWLETAQSARLSERYLTAVERRADLDIARGHSTDLAAELRELTARHPLRESLWVRLIDVLNQAGRPGEALRHYETIRVRLADELGVDPGPDLQKLHAELLAGTSPAPLAAAVTAVRPRQLPADVDGFAGRGAALAALDSLLGEHDRRAVGISVIHGSAGIGKTALAVHWAHRVADRFPDGQLHVDLRGFHPGGQPMPPAGAIRGFLDALGVAAQRVPPDPDAQVGLYRSLLAGRRILVVLDNARDAEQVRPLLPGSAGCFAVVTSRSVLGSLVAAHGAQPLTLDLLPTAEARRLLARRLGEERIAAEPAATAEIITRCARLPLALAIVAARAAINPEFPLDALVTELRMTQGGLDAFTAGDVASDVRTVFSWSYHALSPPAARLFRLLGLHHGTDLGTPAAASLAGLPAGRASRLVAELCRAHLLVELSPGRFAFHDLLRAYAAELAATQDADVEQHAAVHRTLDHYLHTAHAAALWLEPQREPIAIDTRQPGVTPQRLADHAQALAWFTAEHRVLLAAIAQAAENGFDTHAWQLAWTVADFLDRQGHWDDWATTQRAGLLAATRLGNRSRQAQAHRILARAWTRLSRFDDAHAHLRSAIDLCRELGDHSGQGRAHLSVAYTFERQRRHADALRHAEQALVLYQAANHRPGQANSLNSVGWYHALLGNYGQALVNCERALDLHHEVGNRHGEAHTWDSLGYAHHHLGRQHVAKTCYGNALELYRDLGDRFQEAATLLHLGDTNHAAAESAAARKVWRAALRILEELGHTDADIVRGRLSGLNGT